MPVRVKKTHPALKHAGYAATSLLPGESAAQFGKLHQDLIAELVPNGALEDDIVASVAHLLWRKQNFATFRIAELARSHCQQIENEEVPSPPSFFDPAFMVDPALREAGYRAAEVRARKELGDTYELVEIGEAATVDAMMKDLEIQERLDAMIYKCLKRLLFLRGLKSISEVSSSAPPKSLAGPSKAA